jgi:hypothetical protein
MELDGSNLLSVLAFDSRTMAHLLQEEFDDYFTEEFPLFYKQKIVKGKFIPQEGEDSRKLNSKYMCKNALDNALAQNQVGAVRMVIGYITKYQSHYSSSYLFNKNMP